MDKGKNNLKWFKINSLQKKIMITFTILIFFQILLFAVITYWFDTKSIYAQVSEANLLTLDQMKDHLETQINVLDRVSFQLSNTSQLLDFLAYVRDVPRNDSIPRTGDKRIDDFYNLLDFTNRSWPEIVNMYVYNLHGNLAGLSQWEVVLPIPRPEDYEKTQVHIDYGINLSKTDGMPDAVVCYLRLVTEPGTGRPLGWIRLDLMLHEMGVIQDLNKDPRTFLVFEPDGKLVLSNKPDNLDIVTMAKILNISEKRGSTLFEDNLINYTASDFTGWKVVSIVPEKMLKEGVMRLKIISFVLVVVSFIISVIASSYISFRISRPIRNLYRSMKRVEEGNLNIRVDVVSNDEIGQLSAQMNNMMESINHLINQVYKAELKYRDAQFNALLMQIKPHFLYNTLEIIDVLSLKGKQKEVSQTIYALTTMFRYALKSKKYVTLQEEVQHVEAYLNIQSIRYPKHFRCKMRIPEQDLRYTIPIFILQPIIENAFKYSFFRKKWNVLLVYTERDGQYFKIHMIDNGVGVPTQQLQDLRERLDYASEPTADNGENIGLQNIHQRIRLTYGDLYGVAVDSREGHWFKVTLLLPAKEYEGNDV